MRLNDVVQLIRGKRGTTVRLQVLRESELGLDTLKFSIVRDKIVLKEGEAQSHIFEPEKASSELPSLKHRIGVIKLPPFTWISTTAEKIPTITKAPPET